MKHLYYVSTILILFDTVLGGSLPQITNAPVKRDDSSNVVIEAPLADFTKTVVGGTQPNETIVFVTDMIIRTK